MVVHSGGGGGKIGSAKLCGHFLSMNVSLNILFMSVSPTKKILRRDVLKWRFF